MARLEDLKPGSSVRGLRLGETVEVIDAKWHGPDVVELTFRTAAGRPDSELLFRDREPQLEIVVPGRRWSYAGDGALFRLVSEARRIQLAHLFDPLLAVSTSQVTPFPHQITAVYGELLRRQPLRYVLADDPGAGKTIMAGLFIKELIARGDLTRCLIVTPGVLVEQWQDELDQKFGLAFDIMTNDALEAARTGNWFGEHPLAIARLDKLSRNEDVQAKVADVDWDLVVVDEAHKMSASYFTSEVKETKRYKLGKLLSRVTRHFLLMTATPHNGKDADFQLFMALLDGDRFEGKFRDGHHTADVSHLMRRMVKEDLLRFDGTKLFPERIASTIGYTLTQLEARLYAAVTDGTVTRRGASCVACRASVEFEYIRAEGRGGRMGVQLMALVAEGPRQRVYMSPDAQQERIAASAQPTWAPESELPEKAISFRVQAYGMTHHRDLFTPRQLAALTTTSDLVGAARERVFSDACATGLRNDGQRLASGGSGADAYADAVATYLGLATSKMADYNSSLSAWSPTRDQAKTTFTRQSLPMVWDFAEVNPFAGAAGDLGVTLDGAERTIRQFVVPSAGVVAQRDATVATEATSLLISTDPPYYDNIGYADLSDFFYVWLRPALADVQAQLFTTLLTPKSEELIASPYRFDGDRGAAQRFFESGLGRAFERMRESQDVRFPLTVFYAFKQSESADDEEADAEDGTPTATASTGWETMLEGLLRSGFLVDGTWPVRTERGNRSISIGTNALASSIVLVCRPRPTDASSTTRRQFLSELQRELPTALRKLQHGNIAPVDLAQAAIGPGMAVFSRYARVLESDGLPMRVRTALALINQVLAETLAEQEGEMDADTRWALTWFDENGFAEAQYGRAEVLATAKNTSMPGLVAAGIVASARGKVRLLRRDELAADWDPATDARRTVWEATHHLSRTLESNGEGAAAALLARLGEDGERARDLAYRLYTTCERRGWAQYAQAYNALVIAWPEIARQAAGSADASVVTPGQGEMFA